MKITEITFSIGHTIQLRPFHSYVATASTKVEIGEKDDVEAAKNLAMTTSAKAVRDQIMQVKAAMVDKVYLPDTPQTILDDQKKEGGYILCKGGKKVVGQLSIGERIGRKWYYGEYDKNDVQSAEQNIILDLTLPTK